jgi:lambda family phage portal protein
VARNPILKGVIETHVADTVGANGPRLQVRTADKEYSVKLEKLWRDWWEMPDAAGQLAGTDKLKQWIRGMWMEGEFFEQKVTSPNRNDFPRLRIQSIAAARIETRPQLVGNLDWQMGILRNALGAHTHYSIQRGIDELDKRSFSFQFDVKEAKDIIHVFDSEEPGQIRGVPWAATQLQVISDLRIFDEELLNLMRKGAHFGIMLTTDFDGAEFLNLEEETEMEPNLITAIPPHWKPSEIDPKQPTGDIINYRKQRTRELGAPVGMPEMIINHDSSGHNYSSARFDAQQYWRAISTNWSKIVRSALNPLVNEIALEGRLFEVLGQEPDDVEYDWTWTKQGHVDPAKEAKGQEIRINNQLSSLKSEMALSGEDWEEHLEQLSRESAKRVELGLPLPVAEGTELESPDTELVSADDEEALLEALMELQGAGSNAD